MLEGLEISVLNLTNAYTDNITHRLDSEYFLKDFLRRKKTLTQKSKKLSFFMNEGSYGILPKSEDYLQDGLPLIRGGDIRGLYLNNLVKVPFSYFNEKYKVLKGDLLILVKGATIGYSDGVFLVQEEIEKTIFNGSVFRIRLNDRINKHFVFVFMQTKYFTFQKILAVANNGIEYNSLEFIKNFLIPDLDTSFQKIIEELVVKANVNLQKSQLLYSQAESLLLEKVGLDDYKPNKEPINIKSFKESFLGTGRLDAEYYQPKFDELVDKLQLTNRAKQLAEVLDFTQRGKQPNYTDGKGLVVINSKYIRKNKIDFAENRKGDASETPESLIIRKGDVLLNGTGVGTIGRCAPYLINEPALPDNHVTILRTKTMRPIFLSVMLNSIIGQMQVDKFFKGSSGQIELYPADINQFVVWDAPETIQLKIEEYVLQAYELENHSQTLIELAKQAVEIAIEESELKSINFINSQLGKQ